MSQLVNYQFNNIDVNIITIGSDPWFVAKDVADSLGYSDAYEMTKRLDSDEIQNRQIAGYGNRGVNLINESGLYSAILGSRKPEAKEFKKWVTSEVLPQVRKTGSYQKEPAKPVDPASLSRIDILKMAIDSEERRLSLQKENDALCVENLTLHQHIEDMKPTVNYAKRLMDSDKLFSTTLVAQKINTTANELHLFLSQMGVIKRVGKTWAFQAKYLQRDLGKTVTYVYGSSSRDQLKWSEKGRKFIIELWEEFYGAKPCSKK